MAERTMCPSGLITVLTANSKYWNILKQAWNSSVVKPDGYIQLSSLPFFLRVAEIKTFELHYFYSKKFVKGNSVVNIAQETTCDKTVLVLRRTVDC